MKSKLEQKLDLEFEVMNIKPRTYHFINDVCPFNGITIVDERLTWENVRRHIFTALYFNDDERWRYFFPATRMVNALHARGIYGIAICDGRDSYSRQRGRIIAKGRLLKHLEEADE